MLVTENYVTSIAHVDKHTSKLTESIIIHYKGAIMKPLNINYFQILAVIITTLFLSACWNEEETTASEHLQNAAEETEKAAEKAAEESAESVNESIETAEDALTQSLETAENAAQQAQQEAEEAVKDSAEAIKDAVEDSEDDHSDTNQ